MNTIGSQWIFNASGTMISVGLALFGIYVFITLYHLRQVGLSPLRIGSEALKFCGALLLLFTLLQPEIHSRHARNENARVAVVVDTTDSMKTQDAQLLGAPATRSEWVAQLMKTPEWLQLAEAVQLEVLEMGHDENPLNRETNLQASLARARSVEQLAAVLMLSDGAHNAGSSPLPEALRLAEAKIPVFGVEIGNRERLPDLMLEKIQFPSYSLVNEALVLPVRVSSTLPEDAPARLVLLSEGQPVARQDVLVPAGRSADTSFRWIPRTAGNASLTVEVEAHPLERFTDNNLQSAVVDIRKTTIRVLVIESWPRWEFRYLRNALIRDPGVQVDCLLFHPELGVAKGPGYIPEFPTSREMWSQYDVVFLGDVGLGRNELRPDDLKNIDILVREQGSGLVFLPGARGGHLRLENTPVEQLMPIEYDRRLPNGVGLDLEMRMALTREGQGHLLTQLHGNPIRNQQIWRGLPGFYWFAAVARPRVGAEVLATHASQRNENGRIPLLATRNAGVGHVLFLGTDAAWRWREGVEDLYHYRFWGQVVRWMAHKRHMFSDEGARVFLQPERPQSGQPVTLNITLRGTVGVATDVPVRVRLTTADGEVVSPVLSALEGGGTYQAQWTPTGPGDVQLEIFPVDDLSRALSTSSFSVEGRSPEEIGEPMRPAILREVAQVTGGQSVDMDAAVALLAKLRELPRQQLVLTVNRVWQHSLWVTGVFVFFGLYWILRKRNGWI
jgi:uncharacterized membrane protein